MIRLTERLNYQSLRTFVFRAWFLILGFRLSSLIIHMNKTKTMRTLIACFVCLLMAIPAYSQTRVVKGKITAFNQYPVQNVEVASKKGKSAVVTDSLGQFELVCNEKDVILVKTKVFEPLNKRVSQEDDYVSANLVFKDSEKNRALASSLGYIKPDQLSYALVHLVHENNDFCNYPDIFSLMRVHFPEVQIQNGPSGAEGVYIRGKKSINLETEAAYEVDGMRVADISFVNPCEISSIEIMKGGGIAVYGTQAVNGVVIIKTKAMR